MLVVSSTSSASLETLKDYFYSIWDGEYAFGFHGGSELLEKPKSAAALSELHEIYAELKQSRPELFESAASHWDDIAVPVNAVTLLSNPTGIYGKEPVLYYELTELMALNGGETVFHTPYIVANSWMLERLEKVGAECASLTMLTNSVGNAANIFGAAEYQSNRDELLDMGIQLLEYDTGTAYHGKCVRIGDRLSVVGSMNFDMRSVYIDTELMLVIDSRELNAELAAAMGKYEAAALTVAPDGTVTTPAGQPAEPASAAKRFAAKAVHYTIGWAKFLF
ncbi:MAG: phospholipase D-like domain-containing protein [Oscillospiraceae bacterium]|nr:phospholipase D-like domain-containing protein [Oscillospiraceae bacterium]